MTEALEYLVVELARLEEQGLLHPRTLEGRQLARARYDGREVINLASNNYLGLAAHPRMNEAASRAAAEYGAGTGAVRTIAGQMTMHRELEQRFAAFKGAEDAHVSSPDSPPTRAPSLRSSARRTSSCPTS